MILRGLDRGQKAALLISECQNGIVNPAYTQSTLVDEVTARDIIPKIAALAAQFRSAGLPVIHCTIAALEDFAEWKVNCVLAAQIKRAGKLVTGTPFAAVHDDLDILPGDIVIERHHGMAPFTGTQLDAILRGFAIDTVVLAGVSTNIALPGASTEAVALGYDVVLAEDCAAGGTAETHQLQISMHLPLIATISDAAAIGAAIGAR